jgi:hypothetical protein
MPFSLTKRDGIFLLIATSLVLLYVLVAGTGFPLDDSWIHQTYGRNLALHGQWAFVLGQPSAASTSPLYTVLLAIGYFLRIPYLWWTHGLGILALTLTAMLGARMAERILPKSGLWAGLGLLGTWHLVWAASAGMETMLFGMLGMLLVFLAWHEMDNLSTETKLLLLRGFIFGIASALCTLARPEGLLIAGLAALFLLLLRPQGKIQYIFVYGIGAAIAFALTIAPYLWLNFQLTGGFLPNTANAKFEQHAILLQQPYLNRFFDLAKEIFIGGQMLLIPGIIAYLVFVLREKRYFLLLPLIWSIAHIALYAARLPASYQHGRYVMPALPALVFAGVVGLLYLLRLPINRKSLPVRLALRVLGLSYALVSLAFLFLGMNAYKNDVAVINSEMVAAANYIAENIPPDELLAIHDIGAVGYFAPRPMIDIAGLISPGIIPIVANPDALWQYLEEHGAVYLMAFPDQIPNDNPDDPRLCEVFNANSAITRQLKGREGMSMAIYRLAWDENCEN